MRVARAAPPLDQRVQQRLGSLLVANKIVVTMKTMSFHPRRAARPARQSIAPAFRAGHASVHHG